MEITSVVLEERSHRLAREELLIRTAAQERGLTVYTASEKQMERSRFRMNPTIMAVGGVRFVKHALRQLGSPFVHCNPYPDALSPMLRREVRHLACLRTAKEMIARGERLFVKPVQTKRFTGFVPESEVDYRFNGTSNDAEVWISTPVNFVSEWRFYVANGRMLEYHFADHGGDPKVQLQLYDIYCAMEQLFKSKPAPPAGFVVDWGVLDNGLTALVEMNDGFSFGAYGMVRADTMWEVTYSRWLELIKEKK